MSEPTPETSPEVAQVRALMADVGSNQYLTDTQIQTYLDLNDANVRRAAAEALEAIAVSELLVGKVIRTQDLQTDASKIAAELRALAARLRQTADEQDAKADGWDGFDVVDTLPGRTRPEATEWPIVTGL